MNVNWFSNPINTYLTLKAGVNSDEFNDKLNNFYQAKRPDEKEKCIMFLQRYSDRYLYGHYDNGRQAGGRIDYVVLFSIIALFILAIACINFMNLSTARASRRLKEVGVKKAIGVLRRTIAWQYLGESVLMAMISLVVAVILVYVLLPQFSLISGKHLVFQPDWQVVTGILAIVLFTGLASGSYPALYLSAFRPAEVLKGKLNTSISELWLRKGLVIFQFSISILLIIAVGVVYMQMDLIQSKNLGYTKDNVITFERKGKLNSNLESFLSETRNLPGVTSASCVSESITNINSTSWGHTWEGQLPGGDQVEFSGVNVGYDFIETVGIQIKEGRSFSPNFGDEASTVILNEAVIEAMHLANPIGKWIDLFGTKREIVGIVKNFHYRSMYETIKPIFVICNPNYTDKVVLKIRSDFEQNTIAELTALYNRFDPGIPFEVKFLDDEYQALYMSEQRVGELSRYFASIAIVISCLGLFGLAAFTAERRTKEIGIRKIFGCSEIRIIRMLSGDFTKMVLISIMITIPVSYLMASRWLSHFAYRITLEWWYFFGAGFIVLLIAWITVGLQTVRAARINTAECLRNE